MAITQGRIVRLNWLAEIVCVFVGTATSSAELFTLQFHPADSASVTEHKRLLSKLLATAFLQRREVNIYHSDTDPIVHGIDFIGPNISPVGQPIHDDFYAITGAGIPQNANVVFRNDIVTVTVTPGFRRPHGVLIEQLPAGVPLGPCEVFLQAPGFESDHVPVTVMSGPPMTNRTLFSGRMTPEPYTFVFAASPAIETPGGASVVADQVLSARAAFADTVRFCLDNMLNVTETLLRESALEENIRFVVIFDAAAAVTAANALVRQVSPNLLEPQRARLNAFVGRYLEDPDIVFCISGSTTHTRASAWYTTDDGARAGVNFVYDGTTRTHRRFTNIPGSAALSTNLDMTGLTGIHEYFHAASDFDNGKVYDLYVDSLPPGFTVNKKARSLATNPVPANFCVLDGTTFQSDQNRDGLGYPAGWTSYHAAQLDTARPNLMDNYWQAASNVQACRLDGMTFEWLGDRLRTKILR
jgi:hypothetical protein